MDKKIKNASKYTSGLSKQLTVQQNTSSQSKPATPSDNTVSPAPQPSTVQPFAAQPVYAQPQPVDPPQPNPVQETSDGWVQVFTQDPVPKPYYVNKHTQATQWHPPPNWPPQQAYPPPPNDEWLQLFDSSNRPYYANKRTNATQWDPPAGFVPTPQHPPATPVFEPEWTKMYTQDGSNRPYYSNKRTGQSVWDPPPGYVDPSPQYGALPTPVPTPSPAPPHYQPTAIPALPPQSYPQTQTLPSPQPASAFALGPNTQFEKISLLVISGLLPKINKAGYVSPKGKLYWTIHDVKYKTASNGQTEKPVWNEEIELRNIAKGTNQVKFHLKVVSDHSLVDEQIASASGIMDLRYDDEMIIDLSGQTYGNQFSRSRTDNVTLKSKLLGGIHIRCRLKQKEHLDVKQDDGRRLYRVTIVRAKLPLIKGFGGMQNEPGFSP